MSRIGVTMLGQSGVRLDFDGHVVYVDPYLSDSVRQLDSSDLERLTPIVIEPALVVDAATVIITHDHIDHCDPHTLPAIAKSSPLARFIGPSPVLKKIAGWGVEQQRLGLASEHWIELSADLQIRAVPAAHPEIQRDENGCLSCVGYLLDYRGQRIYFAGDTFVRQEIIDVLCANGPIDTAFLPVNEHNFFRGRRGIIGNMSVREAFQLATEIGVRQVVAVHWDMFAINAVDPDEIRLIHKRMNPSFKLLLNPTSLGLGKRLASIVVRTLNEARYLDELLKAVASQRTDCLDFEIVLVDSGSTDGTLNIAEQHGCRIRHIAKSQFSFGRSLNIGCEAAMGDILVFISGHCVPTNDDWLQRLCQPILDGVVDYSYGRQLGGSYSHYSEKRIFAKYFPEKSLIPQNGFYCNNANSALLKETWEQYRFDEELTGLEDMDLAQRIASGGKKIAYIADAGVYHYHHETWAQVRRRFEREAIALQKIMPQVHVGLIDVCRYVLASVWKDWINARKANPKGSLVDIVRYRWNQYVGGWKGNHQHRKLSHTEKEKYFFPR